MSMGLTFYDICPRADNPQVDEHIPVVCLLYRLPLRMVVDATPRDHGPLVFSFTDDQACISQRSRTLELRKLTQNRHEGRF